MALRVWRAGIAAGQAIRNRFRLQTAHGVWRWTSVLAAPVRHPDGSVRKWVGMNIDIDTEQRAEDLLRASEMRLWARPADQACSRLFEAAPAPLLVVGTDAPRFTIREVNSAYLAATMRRREDLVGCGIVDAWPDHPQGAGGGTAAALRASFEHVLASRESDCLPDLRYDIVRADGSVEERWWRPINAPVLDGDGMVEAVIHHAIDVTTARRA